LTDKKLESSMSTTELNIFSLINIIINNKFKILISVIFFLSAGIIYVNIYPPTFKAVIKIDQIGYDEISHYSFLNTIKIKNIDGVRKENEREREDAELISPEKLLEIFVKEFSSLEGLIFSLEKNNPNLYSHIENDEVSKRELLLQVAKGFNIEEKLSFKKTRLSYLISFGTKDTANAKLILKDALDYTNKKVNESLIVELENIKNALANDAVYESKKIALETLLYLKNQLLIAEKFEISEPTMERQIINLLKDNIHWETRRIPHYTLGTNFLIKHIKDLELVMSDLSTDETEILNTLGSVGLFSLNPLHQMRQVARLEEAIRISPINQNTFKAVEYDIELTDFSKSAIHTLILIAAFVTGLLFGIFVSVFYSIRSSL